MDISHVGYGTKKRPQLTSPRAFVKPLYLDLDLSYTFRGCTLKVAQIARRLAERFLRDQKSQELIEGLGGLDPDVAEVAALAHDLGHPPFGHIAEKRLNELVKDQGESGAYDGYEGNAQSFRIVTKLAIRRMAEDKTTAQPGLNLTFATLNALLKYPWPQTPPDQEKPQNNKWGVYQTEIDVFKEVRKLLPPNDTRRSLEAEIMDWADDLAYAIHDLEDFYRAGLIPLDQLRRETTERQNFLRSLLTTDGLKKKGFSEEEILEAYQHLTTFFPAEPFRGTREETALLATASSILIHNYVFAISLNEAALADPSETRIRISRAERLQVNILQTLTRFYVIDHPSLASQQYGETRIISTLFDYLMEASAPEKIDKSFPVGFRAWLKEELGTHKASIGYQAIRARVVADKISSLTDDEALRLYQRITGTTPGSILDRV